MTEDPDPLDRYWALFDAADPLLCAQETAWWPPGALEGLVSAGLLGPAASAAQAACTECPGRHVEEVEVVRGPGGAARYFIPCPENHQIEIDAEELRQWRPDFKALARRLKELLNIDGRARDRVAERVWRLGTASWQGRPREAYLARGLAWEDGETVAREIPTDDRPIVFVGRCGAPPAVWPALAPAVVPLATVLHSEGDGLSLDVQLLARLVGGADETAAYLGHVAETDLRRRFRQYADEQLAEGGTLGLIAACKSQGMSVRATALEMTKRGVPLHPSSINRKIKKVVQAHPPPSSNSVLREPSSQPRDKRGRPIKDAQPKKDQ